MSDIDWETWLIEDAGYRVIEKKAANGAQSLTQLEQLIYDLWVADYGMRNAGDLETAADLYAPFHAEAADLAVSLRLGKTAEAFALSRSELEASYFDRFDGICEELAAALQQGQ